MQTMTKHLSAPSILFAIGIGFANMCGGTGVANAKDFPTVRYEVSGPGVAETITYQTVSGQRHEVNVPLPWSTEFDAFGGQVFVLSAQAQGTVSCKILLDGNQVSNTSSTGTPGRAMCSH
jgi:hypothetical protein